MEAGMFLSLFWFEGSFLVIGGAVSYYDKIKKDKTFV